MKTLIVFDSWLAIKELNFAIFNAEDEIHLFALTSRRVIVDALQKKLSNKGCKVNVVRTGELINYNAEKLRGRYLKFIATLPKQFKYNETNLKEFFAIDKYASLWWFSLVAEKNTYKSNAFNTLVQFDAIVDVIDKENIKNVVYSSDNNKLRCALTGYTKARLINFKTVPTGRKKTIKNKMLEWQQLFFVKHAIILLYGVITFFFKTLKIKNKLNKFNSPRRRLGRISEKDKALICITYYPNFDISLAKKEGILKNKHFGCLQDSMEDDKANIIWIAMYVQNNIMDFTDSINYAEKFIEKGYNLFLLEEFNSVFIQVKSLFTMIKSAIKFLRVKKIIAKMHEFNGYNFYAIFKDDWYSSFMGRTGYYGILYYNIFKLLFDKLGTGKYLYFCEMHAWEKALILARNAVNSENILLSYQPCTVSKMLLNYFNHKQEIEDNGNYPLPKPDKILCNGQVTYRYMKECGWEENKIMIVEAVKYNYLKKYLGIKWEKRRKNVLLLFSIDPRESSSILNIAYESLKDIHDIEVWIRPHPFLQLEEVFRLAGISQKDCFFQIKNGAIEDIFSEVRIVIGGETGVCIEALAFGCEVINVNVPEWINMSPLKNINSKIIRTVNSADELEKTVLDIFDEKYNSQLHIQESQKIINDYFYLNKHKDLPEKFLKLLN